MDNQVSYYAKHSITKPAVIELIPADRLTIVAELIQYAENRAGSFDSTNEPEALYSEVSELLTIALRELRRLQGVEVD